MPRRPMTNGYDGPMIVRQQVALPQREVLTFSLSASRPDGADHDIVADDIAWRAVETERLGKLEALLKGRLDFGAREILFQARHVEADVLGYRKRAGLVGLAAAAEQLLVEFEVFLAGLVLHAHRDRDLRRLDRARPKDREFLQHDLELGIVLHQREHVVHGALAVAAVVVEELNEGDVAVRISQNDLARRAEDGLRILLDRRLVLFRIRRGLTFLELGHRVLDDFRVGDQVVAHDALHFAALAGGQFIGARGLWHGYRQEKPRRRQR